MFFMDMTANNEHIPRLSALQSGGGLYIEQKDPREWQSLQSLIQ
jgi:hypothetical protein